MEKITIDKEIYDKIKYWSGLKPENAMVKIEEYLKEVKPKTVRTNPQNKALHKDFSLIAEKLNDMGLDMRKVLKPTYFIPWTTVSIKEHIFKPIMKSMYGLESTKELSKHGDLEKIHNVIMRELGEKHGVEYHEFPNDPKKSEEFYNYLN